MAYIGNFLITKLSGDITSSATTMMVTSGDGVKFGAEMIRLYGTELFPYYLVIHSADYQQATLDPEREIVKVTGRDEDTFTIVRGQRGTTASAHSVNDIVQLSIQADDVIVPLSGLINPDFTTPLYVSANSFTVAGDVTSWLKPGRGLRLTFQTSGVKICLVTSLSYSGDTDKTTINTTGDGLVNETITSAEITLSDLEAVKNYANDKGSSNYIRLGDTQICWGSFTYNGLVANNENLKTITLPASFTNTSFKVIWSLDWCNHSGFAEIFWHYARPFSLSVDKDKFNFSCFTFTGTSYVGTINWIAIGLWQ